MLAAGLLGVPVGTRLLTHLDPAAFRLGMGARLLAYLGFMLLGRFRTRIWWSERVAESAVGFASGILGGLAGLPGPLPTVCTAGARTSGTAYSKPSISRPSQPSP